MGPKLKVEWILISHRAVFCCDKVVSCCDRAVSCCDRAVSFGRAGRGLGGFFYVNFVF